MKPKFTNEYRKWIGFLDDLNHDQTIALIYHSDIDGLIGAAYIYETLKKRSLDNQIILNSVSTEDYDFEDLVDWFTMVRPDVAIFSDISIENHPKALTSIASKVNDIIFIYDHHIILYDFANEAKIILANPTPTQEISKSSPKPTFLFAREIALAEKLAFPNWLLLLAIFSEGVETFFKDESKVLLSELFPSIKSGNLRDGFNQTHLKSIGGLVRAGFVHEADGTEHVLLSFFRKIATGEICSYSELNSILLLTYGELAAHIEASINKEVEFWSAKIDKDELTSNEPVIMFLKQPTTVAGPVASILRGKYTNRSFVSIVKYKDKAIVELRARNGSCMDFPKILSEISSTVPMLNYGGHPSASGASLKYQCLDKFIDELRKKYVPYIDKYTNSQ